MFALFKKNGAADRRRVIRYIDPNERSVHPWQTTKPQAILTGAQAEGELTICQIATGKAVTDAQEADAKVITKAQAKVQARESTPRAIPAMTNPSW
jgi:hypothetical protein